MYEYLLPQKSNNYKETIQTPPEKKPINTPISYNCNICNYFCGNRKSNYEKHIITQKHFNKCIKLDLQKINTNPIDSPILHNSFNINTSDIIGNTNLIESSHTGNIDKLAVLTKTIHLLTIQNQYIIKHIGLLSQKGNTISPATSRPPAKPPSPLKIIEYLTNEYKNADNIFTFYNQERGVSFKETQMNIEKIITTDIETLVYEWFCTKIDTIDKEKLPLHVFKKNIYIKVGDKWEINNEEKQESFLETFLLPFCDFLIKTNNEINNNSNATEKEKIVIERMMTKYFCMSKETKTKLMKKILKHPKLVCNIKKIRRTVAR